MAMVAVVVVMIVVVTMCVVVVMSIMFAMRIRFRRAAIVVGLSGGIFVEFHNAIIQIQRPA